MNRLQYILLISAAVLATGCSKHIPQPEQSESSSTHPYIFFDQEVVESVETKTTMVNGDKLPSDDGIAFGVMGYVNGNVIFNNSTYHQNNIAKVERDGEGYDKPFTYQGLVQWTDASSTHNFYAFYPYSLEYLVQIGQNNRPYIRYAQASDTDNMKDILTAAVSVQKQPVVTLTFQHRLWALDLMAQNNRQKKDSVYNTSTGTYTAYDPIIKIKTVKIDIAGIPAYGNIYMDGTTDVPAEQANNMSLSKTITVEKTLNPGDNTSINGQDSFLFLPHGTFRYRLTIEFENVNLGQTYTTHYPGFYENDLNGDPIEGEWAWATASGPDRTSDGKGDGFLAARRYTLDITKGDYEVTFVWKETEWGEWDEKNQEWDYIEVPHSFY